jgi:riboflavin synthase alpha subunit
MIGEFTSSPAGYIRLWLARRGVDNNDIHKLIKQSFSNFESKATREAQIIAGHVIDGHIVSRQVSVRENIEVSHLELAQIDALPPDLVGKEFNVIDGLQFPVLYYITLSVLSTTIVLAVLMVGWLLWKERWKSIL